MEGYAMTRKRSVFTFALAAVLAVAAVAVASAPPRDPSIGESGGPVPRSLTLAAPQSVLFGDTASVSAIAFDTRGRRVPRAVITFSVSDTTIAQL